MHPKLHFEQASKNLLSFYQLPKCALKLDSKVLMLKVEMVVIAGTDDALSGQKSLVC